MSAFCACELAILAVNAAAIPDVVSRLLDVVLVPLLIGRELGFAWLAIAIGRVAVVRRTRRGTPGERVLLIGGSLVIAIALASYFLFPD